MNLLSLLPHIGAGKKLSSKLLVALVLSVTSSHGQSSSNDIAARMESSTRRQMLAIEKMKASAIKTSAVARPPSVTKSAAGESRSEFFLLPPPPRSLPASAETRCDPLPATDVDALLTEASEASSVSPDILRSVMKEESGFRPCAVSEKGAIGLMQLMQATAGGLGVTDAFDPLENSIGGARFLKQLLDRYNGDVSLALSAYNAGTGPVDKASGIPNIPETIDYVRQILSTLPKTK